MTPPNKYIPLDENGTLTLSILVDNTKINNANSFVDRTKLDSLQEWVREQIKIYNN